MHYLPSPSGEDYSECACDKTWHECKSAIAMFAMVRWSFLLLPLVIEHCSEEEMKKCDQDYLSLRGGRALSSNNDDEGSNGYKNFRMDMQMTEERGIERHENSPPGKRVISTHFTDRSEDIMVMVEWTGREEKRFPPWRDPFSPSLQFVISSSYANDSPAIRTFKHALLSCSTHSGFSIPGTEHNTQIIISNVRAVRRVQNLLCEFAVSHEIKIRRLLLLNQIGPQ